MEPKAKRPSRKKWADNKKSNIENEEKILSEIDRLDEDLQKFNFELKEQESHILKQDKAAENYKAECLKEINKKEKERIQLHEISNYKSVAEMTEILDKSLDQTNFKIPAFDTLMYLPANYRAENQDEEIKDEDYQNMPLRDDLDDPFYLEENKLEEYDEIDKIFKKTCEKKGIDAQDINLQYEDSFQDIVIKSVIDKFNSTNSVPEISGFLKKQMSGFIKSWQKRYFVCRGKELCYFRSPNDTVLRGCINFDICDVSVSLKKKKPIISITMKGLSREILLKAENQIQAESWKAIIQHQIERSDGKIYGKFVDVKKWWKMKEADYSIFKKTANSGDILIFHMSKEMVEKGDHPDDLYHYALIVRDSLDQEEFKVYFYDCILCEYKICSFQEFYESITSQGFTELMYRKVFSLRDSEFFERQKEFFNCDPEIQMNTVKMQSTQLMKRMQLHALLENQKCYCMDMVETYLKCMKILNIGQFFTQKSDLNLIDTKKITCSIPMKVVNVKF